MTSDPNESSHGEKPKPYGPTAMLNRRTLLGSAAGGFALAATGLLLPERLIEVAAAGDHPVRRIQGRKDGQRGQRQRRLERRREQNRRHNMDKNDDTQGRGQIYKGIAFVFEISGGRSVRVSAHNLLPSRGYLTDRWFQSGLDGPYAPGTSKRVDFYESTAALWIDKNLWLKAENTIVPWENPVLWFGYGGSFDPDGEQPFDNGTFLAKSVLAVGSFSYKLERDGYTVQAQRLADDEKGYRKVFNVKITSPSA